MNSIAGRNQLHEASSPYLTQHADNPVHWQLWGEPSLQLAQERDVPLFVSIGYAACHWCHVMESESFEDPTIANILNASFVPIKIDREELPDIDRLYQTVAQLVNGRGGWPLSVWATPDGRPFYIGTYFPPTPARGRPGFPTICEQIAASWEADREAIEERADEWISAAESHLRPVDSTPTTAVDTDNRVITAATAACRGADREHGGFGSSGPKFPQAQRIELLLQAAVQSDRSMYLAIATEALDAMADRGLYDHLGGGFHRYATDQAWEIPHFEKMLYDNAELARIYLYASQVTGDDRYRKIASETLDFVTRELRSEEGGAFCSLDAQSGGKEGTYYVWSPSMVRSALEDNEAADIFCRRFGVTDAGNFEQGMSVLRKVRSVESLASEFGVAEAVINETLGDAKETLQTARDERERPRRDEKVLASWNGLLLSAYAEAGLVLDARFADEAEQTLSFLQHHLWDEGTEQLFRRYRDGTVGIPGYLDDYAFVGRGALNVYECTGNHDALAFACTLGRLICEKFWDDDEELLSYTQLGAETVIGNQQDLTDQSIPSSAGVAISLLSSLESIALSDVCRDILDRYIPRIAASATSAPTQHATVSMALHRAETHGVEVTLGGGTLAAPWGDFIAETYIPHRFMTRHPGTESEMEHLGDVLGINSVPPVWDGRGGNESGNPLYICHNQTCSPPLSTQEEATAWLEQFGFRS